MDEQTQSFLELSAKDDLVPLVADKKAAWLFSADGARILWANSAGAAFFSAQSLADLTRLTALERSPARPHIARIAEAGATDKFSIDRLRFYRGLRVMLLTCQCKRVELETGDAAALIVCGDKGLTATKDPLAGFAQLLASETSTVFVSAGGAVVEQQGALAGSPEDLDLPEGQQALFGPIELNGAFHEGAVLKVSDRQKLIVLDNSTQDADENDAEEREAHSDVDLQDTASAALAGGAAAAVATLARDKDSAPETPASDEESAWVRADEAEPETDESDTPTEAVAETEAEAETEAVETAPAEDGDPVETIGDIAAADDNVTLDESAESATRSVSDQPADPSDQETDLSAPAGDLDAEESFDISSDPEHQPDSAFVFQPQRRPVRFAWKMDIDQRFTFLSDEFAEVLGPTVTDIVGQTWAQVAERFDLDPRGQIARALDRRDTWSGKTIDWPVSGADLRVPVDMAALPAFDRNRKFEGYRGFGVCRTTDAVRDAAPPALTPVLAAGGAAAAAALLADTADAADEDRADLEATDEVAPDQRTAPETDDSETGQTDPGQTDLRDAAGDAASDQREEQTFDEPRDQPEPEPETVAETEENRDPPQAAASLADLKPAQPDSLAGKTFLGASAAALVGSIARFTGKSAPRQPEAPEPVETPKAAEDDRASGGAAKEDADSALPPADPASSDDATADLPGAALDSRLEALQSGKADPSEVEAASSAADETAEPATDNKSFAEAAVLETEPEIPADADLPDADEMASDAADDGDAAADTIEDIVEDIPEAVSSETVEASESEADHPAPPETEEPAGISGPAALAPAEIESAVKSLAKSYKAAESKSPDLFDKVKADLQSGDKSLAEEPADADVEQAAAEAGDDLVTDPAAISETGEPEEVDRELAEPAANQDETPADDLDEDGAIETTAAELDGILEAEPETEDSTAAAEEREFFEETAAFETEDQAAEAAEDAGDKETPTTGEVIPLATVKPRVVPVDTSGLSRPERAAFRKIAEALGARLEGDLEDFDAPDAVDEEPEEDLPPEVPEAGPIDPSLLDRLPIGIAIVHDREVLYANKALLAMLGYKSIAKLSQVGGLEALFIDDAEELPDAAGMDGEVDESMKLRLADGGVLTVDAHMHSVPWNGSRGLMISITERKTPAPSAQSAPASPNFFAEVRSELDNAHNQIAEMDTILETATDGVLVLDQHGTILKVNGSAEALFSANRADMIGAPFTEFLAPESHRAAADYLDGLSRNGVASILNDGREVLGAVPAGGLIPLFMTMGRISGGEDEAKYCAVLRDITQWKTAEEELTQAKRQAEDASSAKSDFLAKISHEIRTPLNAIIGFSEVMMEERFGPIGNDRYKDYLKDIRTSGSHIMSLVNDLLDLSKIEAGKLDLKFSAVSTSDVINECVALMQPQANRERVIIRASLPEAVPNVVADPRSLRQIVLNLLSNAIKYNRSGGQVILSTALESNGEVALRVRDTGTGMTAKQLTAALEPFRQLHTASRGGGTGLGLPLTKALVEANRASFHIDSTPDQGTLVEIVFPTQRVLSE